MAWSRAQLRAGNLVWLCKLTWAGRVWRFAETAQTADIGDGQGTQDYLDGLTVGGPAVDDVDPFTDSPEPRSMELTIQFPPGVNVPDLVARGNDLGGASVVLMLYLDSTTEAMTVLDGYARDPVYETADDPVEIVAEELPFEDRALWPPVRAVVDSSTWPNASEKADGMMYPWVFGAPPLDTADTFGSPGLVVAHSGNPITAMTLLVAGHHCEAGTVGVRNVTASDDSNTNDGDTFTLVNGTDGDGNPVCTVDLFEGGTTITNDNQKDAYWVRWGQSTHAGGLLGPSGSALRGAGDLLMWWLERSTLRWDSGRVASLAPRLNSFLIDTSLVVKADSRVSPWRWIQEHLLPILPISARVGPRGLYFAWYEWNAKAGDAVASITTANGTCARASSIGYTDRDAVANEIRVSSRVDAESDVYRLTSIVTGDTETLALEGDVAVSHVMCELSQQRHGKRVIELTTDAVSDAYTAGAVAMWKAAALSMQHRIVTYTIPRDLAYLEPGAVVTVTDEEVGLAGAVGLIESIPWEPLDHLDVRVRLLHHGRELPT